MKISKPTLIISMLAVLVLLAGVSYTFYKLGLQSGIVALNGKFTKSMDPEWIESNGIFWTSDIVRAQEHAPFQIILPQYIPKITNSWVFPNISGRLSPPSNDPVVITIIYSIQAYEEIVIHESNYPQLESVPKQLGEESIDINGIQVVKSSAIRNNISTINYEFFSDLTKVKYSVGAINVPEEEVYKVVESIIKQIK